MPENGPGSVAATAPTPEAGHSCGTTMPAKSGQISMAFSGHPSTQLQHPLCYPRAARKQQTCAEAVTLCVTLFFSPASDTLQRNQCLASHQPHVDLQDLTTSSLLSHAHAPTGLSDTCPRKTWRHLTLLRLKLNCHKSLKTENTWQKQHNNPEKICSWTLQGCLTWFELDSLMIYFVIGHSLSTYCSSKDKDWFKCNSAVEKSLVTHTHPPQKNPESWSLNCTVSQWPCKKSRLKAKHMLFSLTDSTRYWKM